MFQIISEAVVEALDLHFLRRFTSWLHPVLLFFIPLLLNLLDLLDPTEWPIDLGLVHHQHLQDQEFPPRLPSPHRCRHSPHHHRLRLHFPPHLLLFLRWPVEEDD